LDILHCEDGLLALQKPAGVAVTRSRWYPSAPDLEASLNYQLSQEKPELLRLGLEPSKPLAAVYNTEPLQSGISLFAFGDEAIEKYRNRFGSGQIEFHFLFLAHGDVFNDELKCDLPLAPHFHQPCLVVSHQTGKKSETRFERLERLGAYSLWEARCLYYRMDQLPLHAFEVGLPVVGEAKYAGEETVYLSRIKGRDYRGDIENERPLYPFPAMHLKKLLLVEAEEDLTLEISAPPPPRFQNLIKQIRNNGRHFRSF